MHETFVKVFLNNDHTVDLFYLNIFFLDTDTELCTYVLFGFLNLTNNPFADFYDRGD